MRITRESLLSLANNSATEMAKHDGTVICIYLTGSLLGQDFMLGNTADIDLVCVHSGKYSATAREVIRVSDEITIDIAHLSDSRFGEPRSLRQDAWLGSFLWQGVKVLYDNEHWFEFMQAGATAQFMSLENLLVRARSLTDHARQLWRFLDEQPPENTTQKVDLFFQALEHGGNAIACMTGVPLTIRRYWQQLPQRAIAAGAPELAGSLQRLVTEEIPGDELWQKWFEQWNIILNEAGRQPKCPAELLPCRRKYYSEAISFLRAENSLAALWILLRTGLKAGMSARSNSAVHKQLAIIASGLGFGGDNFPGRLKGLDQWLDNLESFLDKTARRNGLEI
jgi:hypothetical protein